jgi:hypothetical protein
MIQTTFVLDLSRATRGAAETAAGCRGLDDQGWEMLVAWSDAAGARAAASLAKADSRIRSVRTGSGSGVCDWTIAVQEAHGQHIVFLRPGDVVVPQALAHWREGLMRGREAAWVIGAAPGAPNNDWWLQRDLADSAAALLTIGASFPDCTAAVTRQAWLSVASACPETASDSSRASAWIALALLYRPVLHPEIVATSSNPPAQVDADMLVRVLEASVRRDAVRTAQVIADVGRIASGMRIAQHELLAALDAAERCFGRVPAAGTQPSDWLTRTRLFEGLFRRGDRAVWIWGAGQLGLDALGWLRSRSIPVIGFLDRDARREGTGWGGLIVRRGSDVLDSSADADILVVIASMYHAEIAADLKARGWEDGAQFVVFHQDLSLPPVGGRRP